MKKHTKIYFKAHGYPPHACEVCGAEAVDIHHIEPKGMGGDPSKDVLENLIALCRSCHDKAHAGKLDLKG